MASVGDSRFIYFRLSDANENPVTGRVQTDFAIIFTRSNAICTDVLTISEIGYGRYFANYTASAAGTDYLEIYDAGTDNRVIDVEPIVPTIAQTLSSNLVNLTQDFGKPGALAPTAIPDPADYTMYVFLSSDWQTGNRGIAYAKGQTGLNPNGSWRSPITVSHGTYHVVAFQALN